jgi:hypothetical protein
MTSNKYTSIQVYNSIKYPYDYARHVVPEIISDFSNFYATSKLQPIYFNNFIDVHFIIPLFDIITKL